MNYSKKRLYLVVEGIEMSFTGPLNQIKVLESFLVDKEIPKKGITYTLSKNQFLDFQGELITLI